MIPIIWRFLKWLAHAVWWLLWGCGISSKGDSNTKVPKQDVTSKAKEPNQDSMSHGK